MTQPLDSDGGSPREHTADPGHLGDDIDGMHGRPDEMLAMFDRVGITGSFTFCLDEPDRGPSFTAANDRTLAYAAESPGEFFAVMSEAFFEIPHAVSGLYPQVYDQLRLFYRQDPAARRAA